MPITQNQQDRIDDLLNDVRGLIATVKAEDDEQYGALRVFKQVEKLITDTPFSASYQPK